MTAIDAVRAREHGGQAALLAMTAACWIYLLSGAGMKMSVFATSTLQYPPHDGLMPMQTTWTVRHAIVVLTMWWTMMLAMMLPVLSVEAYRKGDGNGISLRILAEYALIWLLFSIAAGALQFGLEQAGLLDGMRMWSTSAALSKSLLGTAVLAQAWQLARQGRNKDGGSDDLSPSGWTRGARCVRETGAVMPLLFVGGVMNLYWMVALTLWTLTLRAFPASRLQPVATIALCLLLLSMT